MRLEPNTISGARGLVKHQYQTAVEVQAFLLRRDPASKKCTVSGAIVSQDAYLLTQRPLVFVVPSLAAAGGRWPVEKLSITDNQLIAQLGPMLERE